MSWENKKMYFDLEAQGKLRPETMRPNLGALDFYAEAFNELCTCRDMSRMSSISFTDIASYAKIYDVGDFDDFLYVIRAMDNAYLLKKQAKVKTNGQGKASN